VIPCSQRTAGRHGPGNQRSSLLLISQALRRARRVASVDRGRAPFRSRAPLDGALGRRSPVMRVVRTRSNLASCLMSNIRINLPFPRGAPTGSDETRRLGKVLLSRPKDPGLHEHDGERARTDRALAMRRTRLQALVRRHGIYVHGCCCGSIDQAPLLRPRSEQLPVDTGQCRYGACLTSEEANCRPYARLIPAC